MLAYKKTRLRLVGGLTHLFKVILTLSVLFSISLSAEEQSQTDKAEKQQPEGEITNTAPVQKDSPASSAEQKRVERPSQNQAVQKQGATRTQASDDVRFIEFRNRIQVSLCDGRSVVGQLRLRVPPQLRIEHTKNGINYHKSIRMADIDSISFKAWESRYVKRKRQGEIHRFEVSRYMIHLSDGQTLMHKGDMLPFLRNFTLSNSNGEVHLYSYWLDLYKKDKSWHTGLKGPTGKDRVLCHPDVVKKISFAVKE